MNGIPVVLYLNNKINTKSSKESELVVFVDMMMVKLNGLILLRNNSSFLQRSLRIRHHLLCLFLLQFLPSFKLLKKQKCNPLLFWSRVFLFSSYSIESSNIKRLVSSDEEEAYVPKASEESDDSLSMDVESEDEPISSYSICFY